MALDSRLDVTADETAVEFVLVVTNMGSSPVELAFRSGQTADFVVIDDGERWRWSDDRMFSQAVRSRVLAPGESLTERVRWDDPQSGRYAVESTLTSSIVDVTERATFEV